MSSLSRSVILSSSRNKSLQGLASKNNSSSYKSKDYFTQVVENDSSDEETKERNSEKVKLKLMSLWNNVKYGWSVRIRTNFNPDTPIWLLGICYHRKNDMEDRERGNQTLELFKQDFLSRIWFTYRRDFKRISGSNLTSDRGWGCMLRTGQMMMAQAFLCHYLGRHWRYNGTQSDKKGMIHRMIIKMFADDPRQATSPFSVHQLVKFGLFLGKKPGEWYGPSSVAITLRESLINATKFYPILNDICVYVAQDCTVFIDDVIDLCTSKKVSDTTSHSVDNFNHINHHLKATSTFNLDEIDLSSDNKKKNIEWKSLILLIPVRLGGEVLNPIYSNCIKLLFAHPACIGIIGGRPKHSLYFVGVQEDKLIYLDPHNDQEAIDAELSNFPLSSYHCDFPRKMPINKMDPSCTIGFYCKRKEDFQELIDTISDSITITRQKMDYPIFIFVKGRASLESPNENFGKTVHIRHRYLTSNGEIKDDIEEDEFVMI